MTVPTFVCLFVFAIAYWLGWGTGRAFKHRGIMRRLMAPIAILSDEATAAKRDRDDWKSCDSMREVRNSLEDIAEGR